MLKGGELVLCVLSGLMLAGCPGTIEDAEPFFAARRGDAGPVVCPDVVRQIFSNPEGCSADSCHAASAFQAGLDLQSADLAQRLAAHSASVNCGGAAVLTPGDPEASLLYTKLRPDPVCGSQMPLRGTLSDADVLCVRRWIVALAEPPQDAGIVFEDASVMDTGPVLDAGPVDVGSPTPDAGPVDAGSSMPVIIQAEVAQLIEAPLQVLPHDEALGGSYVEVPPLNVPINTDPQAEGVGRMELSFDAARAGTYRIWMRSRAPSVASDSFFFRIDQGPWVKWNDINIDRPQQWAWDGVRNSDAGPGLVDIPLDQGPHVLEIKRREPGLQMDAFIITDDLSFDPVMAG